jgi:hypothetical protein
MSHFLRFALLFLMTGCSVNYPVFGKVQNSDEEFMGTASSSLGGRGSLSMTSNDGVICNGKFAAPFFPGMSVGHFTCADGRSGTFTFNADMSGGEGFGKFSDGKKFRFLFGQHARMNMY